MNKIKKIFVSLGTFLIVSVLKTGGVISKAVMSPAEYGVFGRI